MRSRSFRRSAPLHLEGLEERTVLSLFGLSIAAAHGGELGAPASSRHEDFLAATHQDFLASRHDDSLASKADESPVSLIGELGAVLGAATQVLDNAVAPLVQTVVSAVNPVVETVVQTVPTAEPTIADTVVEPVLQPIAHVTESAANTAQSPAVTPASPVLRTLEVVVTSVAVESSASQTEPVIAVRTVTTVTTAVQPSASLSEPVVATLGLAEPDALTISAGTSSIAPSIAEPSAVHAITQSLDPSGAGRVTATVTAPGDPTFYSASHMGNTTGTVSTQTEDFLTGVPVLSAASYAPGTLWVAQPQGWTAGAFGDKIDREIMANRSYMDVLRHTFSSEGAASRRTGADSSWFAATTSDDARLETPLLFAPGESDLLTSAAADAPSLDQAIDQFLSQVNDVGENLGRGLAQQGWLPVLGATLAGLASLELARRRSRSRYRSTSARQDEGDVLSWIPGLPGSLGFDEA